MATDKELNILLFDQLELLERLEKVAKRTNATEMLEAIAEEKNCVNRKLYQHPPLASEN